MAKRLPFKLPKNRWEEVLPPHQTKYLLEHGWHSSYKQGCHLCHGKGCKRCHWKGVTVSLYDPSKKDSDIQGSIWQEDRVGGLLSIYWNDRNNTFHCFLKATHGDARFELTMPQAWQIMNMIVNSTADDLRKTQSKVVDLGVTAELTGPPVMFVAGLTPKGTQRTRALSKKQYEAVELLKKSGYYDEAGLLEQSCNHECFLVNREEADRARKSIGKIKPGTIFERKEDTVTCIDESTGETVTYKVPTDRSVLSMF